MKAIQQELHDKEGRTMLYKIVPMDSPLYACIEISSMCDLRCVFCPMSSKSALEQRGHVMKNISDETFDLAIEQLKEFPNPLKRMVLSGLGEVLVHPKLPDMIAKAKRSGVTKEMLIFTNAVNLTHDISLSIVDAGLDIITISVNGLNADDYERNCGRRIDYDKFVEQIEFLYKHKGNLRVQLKTVDLCINNDSDKNFFFDTFGDICDYIDIEVISPYTPGVDFKCGHNIKAEKHYSKFKSIKVIRNICSSPFFRVFVSSLGMISFCDPLLGFPYDELDISKQRLIDIWNGPLHKQLMLNLLSSKNEGVSARCDGCFMKNCLAYEEDNLDPYAEELYERISKL